jgi:hypothetical protein
VYVCVRNHGPNEFYVCNMIVCWGGMGCSTGHSCILREVLDECGRSYDDYVPVGRGRPFKTCSAARLLSISISFNRSASHRFVVSECNISSRSLTASLDLETSRLALASCSESRIEVETASVVVRRRVVISSRICFQASSVVGSKAEKGGSW